MAPLFLRTTHTTHTTTVWFVNQLLKGLRDGERLVRPHSRAGERRHAPDRGDALRLGLEHHQVQRLLAMAAGATNHQEGRGDTLKLTRRDIGAWIILHASNG